MANCNTRYNNDKALQENFISDGGIIAAVMVPILLFIIVFIIMSKKND